MSGQKPLIGYLANQVVVDLITIDNRQLFGSTITILLSNIVLLSYQSILIVWWMSYSTKFMID